MLIYDFIQRNNNYFAIWSDLDFVISLDTRCSNEIVKLLNTGSAGSGIMIMNILGGGGGFYPAARYFREKFS